MALREIGELVVLGHAQVSNDQHELRMPAEQPRDALRAGVLAGQRRRPGVDDDRNPGVGQQLPSRVESRIIGGEPSDLQVDLEQAGAVGEGRCDVVTDTRFEQPASHGAARQHGSRGPLAAHGPTARPSHEGT